MQFIKNNWLSIVSLLVGLIGVYLAYYFYEESQSTREPAFLSSESTELFASNDKIGTKNFTIINNKTGKPVTNKIFTQELIFWNNGKLSIRRENILKTLEIKYPDNTEILEATLTESSRQEIINPKATITNIKNSISTDFDILEQDDGIKIRVIYSGESSATPKIDGAIESVKKIKTNEDLQSKNILYGVTETAKTISLFILGFIALGLISSIPDIIKNLFPEKIANTPKIIKKALSLLMPTTLVLAVLIGGSLVFYKSVISHAKEETFNNIPKMTPIK